MKKWLIISASVAICAVLLFVGFINFEKYKLKRDVEEYLLMKGYKSSDIISITTHYGKLPSFGARVIFADEPEVMYFYLEDTDGVRQYATPANLGSDKTNSVFKHQEKKYYGTR